MAINTVSCSIRLGFHHQMLDEEQCNNQFLRFKILTIIAENIFKLKHRTNMTKSDIAVNKFKDGYNCAQSVVYSFSEQLGITSDFALKMANGFGGGMGRKQEVCGAVTGGILVLNLLYGRGENEDKEKQEQTYSKVRELMDRFEGKHQSVNCKCLLGGCELLTAEGQERFRSEKLIDKCHCYVGDAVEILEEMIQK